MIIEKERKSVYYVTICDTCGKEIEVNKDSDKTTCYDCITKKAMANAKISLSFLLGAKIINVEPCDNGCCTKAEELDKVEVETNTGKRITFTVGGWNEHYIEWSE